MRKTLKAFLILSIAVSFHARASTSHLNQIKAKYPFALLGDDHGILTEDDLAINSCAAEPIQFSPQEISYSYWQCFPTRIMSFECDGADYDEDERSIMTILAIVAQGQGARHEYLSNRSISLDS